MPLSTSTTSLGPQSANLRHSATAEPTNKLASSGESNCAGHLTPMKLCMFIVIFKRYRSRACKANPGKATRVGSEEDGPMLTKIYTSILYEY